MSNVKHIQDSTQFAAQVLTQDGLYVVDFYADWCGPCKIMLPVYENLSIDVDLTTKATFIKINRDENIDLIEKFGFIIPTIPRFFTFRIQEGQLAILEDLGGTQSKTSLKNKILTHHEVSPNRLIQKTPNHKPRVAIIGSGPSGLTAGIYAARASLDVTIFTGFQPGGQLTTTTEIENFPGAWDKDTKEGMMGPDLMALIQQQAEHFGATTQMSEIKSITIDSNHNHDIANKPVFNLTDGYGETHQFDSVIIASGATAKYIGLPGEEKWIGKGYHSCATCDGFFYRDKVIAVVGGGDSAMEESNFLTKFASKVYLIHRREEFRASKIMLDRARNNPKIEFVLNQQPIEFLTKDDGKKFAGVKMQNTKDQSISELELDGLFVAIGHIPNTGFAKDLLSMDEAGYLIPRSKQISELLLQKESVENINQEDFMKYRTMSQIPGIFIAGDVEDTVYRQAITAAGDGCRAAIDCEKWLESL